jgi:6-hydroxytryprostatin B O-methyltransferase
MFEHNMTCSSQQLGSWFCRMSLQQIKTPSDGTSERLPFKTLSSANSKSADVVSGHLATNYLPQPSFEADGPSVIVPVNASPNAQFAKQKLLAASLELF